MHTGILSASWEVFINDRLRARVPSPNILPSGRAFLSLMSCIPAYWCGRDGRKRDGYQILLCSVAASSNSWCLTQPLFELPWSWFSPRFLSPSSFPFLRYLCSMLFYSLLCRNFFLHLFPRILSLVPLSSAVLARTPHPHHPHLQPHLSAYFCLPDLYCQPECPTYQDSAFWFPIGTSNSPSLSLSLYI